MSRLSERVVVALAVCLPVPILALSGLSIPLPTTVERIAASLVPWSDVPSLAATPLPRGSIVLAPGQRLEGSGGPGTTPADSSAEPRAQGARTDPAESPGSVRPETERGDDGTTPAGNPGNPGPGSTAPDKPSGGPDSEEPAEPSPDTTQPDPPGGDLHEEEPEEPDLVDDTVDHVDETTDDVLDEVEETTHDATEDVGEVVDGVVPPGIGK